MESEKELIELAKKIGYSVEVSVEQFGTRIKRIITLEKSYMEGNHAAVKTK